MSKKDQKSVGRVSLPAGSFNVQKLSKSLSKHASVDDDAKRRSAISETLDKENNGKGGGASGDQAARVDQKRVDVKRDDLGTTESVLVHDHKSEAAEQAAEEAEETAEMRAAQQKQRAEAIASTDQA